MKNLYADEGEEVASTFRILEALCVPKGAVLSENGKAHYTLYSCCIDSDKLCYHVRTCDGLTVKSVSLQELDSCGKTLLELEL